MNPVSLSQAELRRLEKLATAAGRSLGVMFKHVLKDGFDEVERTVKAVNRGRNEVSNKRTTAHESVTQKAEALLARHAQKRKAA